MRFYSILRPAVRLSPRDSQRSKVYAAERAAFPAQFHYAPKRASLRDIDALRAYVRRVATSAWMRTFSPEFFRRYERGQFRVGDGRGCRRALGGMREIQMPVWSREPVIVLHELAHAITPPDRVTAAHGWQWCQTFLALVRHFLGAEAHQALKVQMKAHKVRFAAPRAKRVLTPEQRLAACERLAKARAARPAKAPKAQEPEDDTYRCFCDSTDVNPFPGGFRCRSCSRTILFGVRRRR